MHHLGFVVDDLERAAGVWHDTAGIGPFVVLEHVRFDELIVDGMPAELDHSTAFAAHGQVFIELQVIHDISPSAEGYFRPCGPRGLNHVCYVADDIAVRGARLIESGMPKVVSARVGQLNITLHDARAELGHMIEVHRNSESFRAFFDQIAAAGNGWDGRDLVIEMR